MSTRDAIAPECPSSSNKPGTDSGPGSRICYDHASTLPHCATDNTFFLTLSQPSGALTLLGIQAVRFGDSWKKTLETFFQNAGLANFKPEGIVHLDRWWVPGCDKMASHAVYSVAVDVDSKKSFSDKFQGVWLSIEEVENAQNNWRMFSSTITNMIMSMHGTAGGMKATRGNELTYGELFAGLQHPTPKKNGFEHLVHAAQFGKEEQELLYKEFMTHSCPFPIMGWVSFANFMKELGWQEQALYDLFRAFDIFNRGGLMFRELLFGLAAVEPNVQHGGPPAEIRCRYIFRYYDRNADSKLSVDEFTALVMDIERAKGIAVDMRRVQEETERVFKVFSETVSRSIPLNNFLTAVGQLKFRGTSYLLRSPVSLPIFLKTRRADDQTAQIRSQKSVMDVDSMTMSMTDDLSVAGLDLPGNTSRYDLAAHSVRVRKSGTLLDVHSMQNTQAPNAVFQGQGFQNQQPKAAQSQLASVEGQGQDTKRILSYDRFNQETQANEMLNGLKYFERAIPVSAKVKSKPRFDWGEVDRTSLAKCLVTLCHQAREIMRNESRLLEIAPPCYIMGDLHGNFPDLLCFERALWKLGPMLTPASFLFLGDFVDRGAFGVEVVSYLFAHKALSPSKFYLLRGNHEIREVQQMFTFYRECIAKFGDRIGREVWEEINATFDCMPLAAVVDKKVFCAHGGIIPPWFGDGFVSIINSVPCPLPKPEETSPLAWELMWNDPDRVGDAQEGEKINPSSAGFRLNKRRGTGHVFSEDALDNFLRKNGFSHVVRAHEVQQCGFQVQHGGKLLTVFSSSKYCGGSNEAACILADKQKLRSIRIDTS